MRKERRGRVRVVTHERFILSHDAHHRARLGVCLRPLGVPVPGHCGPSADEREM